MSKKWNVRRGGTPGAYMPGWFAMNHDASQGAYVDTFGEAINLATNMADAQYSAELRKERPPVSSGKHVASRPEWGDVAAWFDYDIVSEHTA